MTAKSNTTSDERTSHSETPSNSYVSYNSDFNIDINIDKGYKNKLYNIEDDDDNLFKLKNDFYVNYGGKLYKDALDLYKINYDKSIELFDEELYANCEMLLNFVDQKTRCCILKKEKKDLKSEVRDLYNFLYCIKVNSVKIKTWLDCTHIAKRNNVCNFENKLNKS